MERRTHNKNELNVKLLVNEQLFIKLVMSLKSGMQLDSGTVAEQGASSSPSSFTFIETLSLRTNNDEEAQQLLEDIMEQLRRRDECQVQARLQ
jgi:hypothetical protein